MALTNNIYKKINKILVFDVETTGLLPNGGDCDMNDLKNLPYIIQLSFVIYNSNSYMVQQKYNSYIKLNDNMKISDEICKITGITNEKLEKSGKPICEVLIEFYEAFKQCDCIVAHNIGFDSKLIEIEMQRNLVAIHEKIPLYFQMFNPVYNRLRGVEIYCTMKSTRDLCNLLNKKADKNGVFRKKFPRLSELYFHLFNNIPENLHNSMIDTLVCLRCFLKIRLNIYLNEFIFQGLINDCNL